MKFELKITLGNVLTILGGIAIALGGAFALGSFSQNIEAHFRDQDTKLAAIDRHLSSIDCLLFVANIVPVVTSDCYAHGPMSPRPIDGLTAPVGAAR